MVAPAVEVEAGAFSPRGPVCASGKGGRMRRLVFLLVLGVFLVAPFGAVGSMPRAVAQDECEEGACISLGSDEEAATEAVPAGATEAKVSAVIDGDTIEVTLGRKSETVRLLGIDAPDLVDPASPRECFAPEAAERAAELLPKNRAVWLEQDAEDRDDDGRLLRYVWLKSAGGKASLSNETLVKEGFASLSAASANDLKHAKRLTRAEDEATSEEYGVWSECGGAHVPFGLEPVHITIPAIGVDAAIEVVPIEGGVMGVPEDPWNVGWYPAFSRLGQGRNVIMAGHVDQWGYGDVVFAALESVTEGNEIIVTGDDGAEFVYVVTKLKSVDATTPAGEALFDIDGEALTLITCTGNFDGERYQSRFIVQAELA